MNSILLIFYIILLILHINVLRAFSAEKQDLSRQTSFWLTVKKKKAEQFTSEHHKNQFSGTGKNFTNFSRKALECADNTTRSIKMPIYFFTDSSLNRHWLTGLKLFSVIARGFEFSSAGLTKQCFSRALYD